jgi:hypothetical protein
VGPSGAMPVSSSNSGQAGASQIYADRSSRDLAIGATHPCSHPEDAAPSSDAGCAFVEHSTLVRGWYGDCQQEKAGGSSPDTEERDRWERIATMRDGDKGPRGVPMKVPSRADPLRNHMNKPPQVLMLTSVTKMDLHVLAGHRASRQPHRRRQALSTKRALRCTGAG